MNHGFVYDIITRVYQCTTAEIYSQGTRNWSISCIRARVTGTRVRGARVTAGDDVKDFYWWTRMVDRGETITVYPHN